METLWELFAGKEPTEEQKFYAKMYMIGLDIKYDRVTEEDYNFYLENFGEYIFMEHTIIHDETDRYDE